MANELTAMAESLGALLKERKETVAVSESSAAGLISAALLAVPGASAYFMGGAVVYTQAARRALLRVPDDAMTGVRSSSEPYALVKARAVRQLLDTTWGLSETGAAGPKDIGKVMKAVMAMFAGKTVDGKKVNELVRARLSA